jgi:hypothetical protein
MLLFIDNVAIEPPSALETGSCLERPGCHFVGSSGEIPPEVVIIRFVTTTKYPLSYMYTSPFSPYRLLSLNWLLSC